MAIKYRLVRRKNPQDTTETQFIMQHICSGEVTLEQLAEEISKESAFSPADVVGVVTALSGRLKQHLGQGNSVDIGALGRYKIGFKAKPLQTPTAPTAPRAEKFYINYQPSVSIKRWLATGLPLQKEK